MATYGILPIAPFDLEYVRSGALNILEANSSTYKKGAFLVLTSNRVAEAAADPTGVLAIATRDGQNGTDKYTEVWPAKAGVLFEGTLTGVVATTDIGINVGVAKDGTTSYWNLVVAETEDTVTIKSLAPGYEIGDTNARVLFTFDSANILLS